MKKSKIYIIVVGLLLLASILVIHSKNSNEIMSDRGMCEDCGEIKTPLKDRSETKFQCVLCRNEDWFKDLRNGKRVEIKFYLDEYTQGTHEEIIAILAKNKLNPT